MTTPEHEPDGNDEARVVSRRQIHDLKNRLTVVKGMAQLLGRQVQRADWERDRIVLRVEGLQSEISKLEEMIESLRHMPSLEPASQTRTGETPEAPPASGVDTAL